MPARGRRQLAPDQYAPLPADQCESCCSTVYFSALRSSLLVWCEPKDRNLPADMCCLHAVVPVSGVDVLGEHVQAYVVVGIGNLCCDKFLVTQLAFGDRLQVVVPPRMLRFRPIRGDQDRVRPVVEVGTTTIDWTRILIARASARNSDIFDSSLPLFGQTEQWRPPHSTSLSCIR
jgi:hypothetical protein